jgi:AraC family transcriptional activator of pobA
MSPLAKAGMIIKNLRAAAHISEHDHSRPHRDDHYLLVLATSGDLGITIDFENITVVTPMMLLILPGQIHHLFSISNLKGWAISIDPSLIDKEFQLIFERGLQQPLSLAINSTFYGHASKLFEVMEKLQATLENPSHLRANRSILDAVLALFAGETNIINRVGSARTNRGAIIEQAFKQLLKLHYREWKQPANYASELNISVSHLYDTIKSITGDSVSACIQQYCMLEAKRLLCFTKLTVKEIGYQLGYDEPVYFGKLFKKITGFTPLQFRKQYLD